MSSSSNTDDVQPNGSKPLSESTSFRSILPHEPLPNGELGYLCVQGVFQPKKSKADAQKAQNKHNTDGPSFWNKTSLEEELTLLLCDSESDEPLQLPFRALQVHLLDDQKGFFSKFHLIYASPLAALHVMTAWQKLKISSAQLFSKYVPKGGKFSSTNFPSRPLQVMQITATKLPSPSWNQSNPPKFRRFVPRHGEDPDELQSERSNTRFIFLSNLLTEEIGAIIPPFWHDRSCVTQAIRAVMDDFDSTGFGVEVFLSQTKGSQYRAYIGMRAAVDAKDAFVNLQERQVLWQWSDSGGVTQSVLSGPLFVDYGTITKRSDPNSLDKKTPRGQAAPIECTTGTDHVVVPGLVLIDNFCSEAEDSILTATMNGPQAPWAPSEKMSNLPRPLTKKNVQHYGYVFGNKTADVLRDRTKEREICPPVPATSRNGNSFELEQWLCQSVQQGRGWEVVAGIIERIRRHQFQASSDPDAKPVSFPTLNQMTLHLCQPGQSIDPHSSTVSTFGNGLIILSLEGGAVMEFRKKTTGGDPRKLVYLQPRSLLLISGPAQYEWDHVILGRKTDVHKGVALPRRLHIELRLRTVVDQNAIPMPLIESNQFPPKWEGVGDVSSHPLLTPECEREHVHAVYDAIATQWHHTRGRKGVLWQGAANFIHTLPQGSLIADVGCGDGKYFSSVIETGSFVIGTDISLPLLQMSHHQSQEKDASDKRRVREEKTHLRTRPSVAVADCMNIPLRDEFCDAVICIAVLHHISSRCRRIRVLEELARIVKPSGLINVQAWAMEQREGSRRKFAADDVFVPFNVQPKFLDLKRFKDTVGRIEQGNWNPKTMDNKSTVQLFAEANNVEYNAQKGLVVFQRYCHLYRKGELEALAAEVSNLRCVESGFESGNYYMILEKVPQEPS